MTSVKKEHRTPEGIAKERYAPGEIEPRWQARWDDAGLHKSHDSQPGKPNWYALTMFPYPSGDVHIGHWFAFAPADAHARFKRMQGFNVLSPQGFDAFGLPAENAAISRGIHPREWTYSNVENMRRQFRLMGNMYDWDREIVTCDPEYYRWNQLFFVRMFKNDLAYRAEGLANWCETDQTTLANEQVKDGACERCETPVIRRNMTQWFFRITKYADELLDMSQIDWPNKIKVMQTNWVGKSTGVNIAFDISEYGLEEKSITTFTTRIDTVYGVTFIVLAPEHPLVDKLTQPSQREIVQAYIEEAARTSEIERTSTEREKTGISTGAFAVNPLNGERVPILVGDYVLSTYGTGAVMGVPAHDDRDYIFAHSYGLPIRVVVAPDGWNGGALDAAYLAPGIQVNSDEFNGLPSTEGLERIADKIESSGWGERTITYKMRDWLISRQRYWGTPIPMIYCDECGTVPVPEEDLPVLLPEDSEFTPTGRSPLIDDEDFVNTTCPNCGRAAKRETDTMDTFMDSSWYPLRYTSPKNDREPFDPELANLWNPVDQYMGGMEHAVMHLLYARFFTRALRDMGFVDHDEPFKRLFSQGTMLARGKRISKRNNPLNPEPLVEKYGVDTVRLYLMFLGPWDQGGDWSDSGINGISRWLNRLWDLLQRDPEALPATAANGQAEKEIVTLSHATTRRVIENLDQFKFNTGVSALMEYSNDLAKLYDGGGVSRGSWEDATDRMLRLIAPMAPHFADELWERTGRITSVHERSLPEWDEALTVAETVTIIVQINGKLRARLELPPDSDEATVAAAAMAEQNVQAFVEGKQVRKQIYVPGRLLNLVVG